MSRKSNVVDQMSEYFAYKGRIMTRSQYVKENDGPLTLPAIARSCGSWARMLKIAERSYPDRMAIARGGKPQPVVKKEAPKADPIKTAAEALKELSDE
jgi:hypothetical protein